MDNEIALSIISKYISLKCPEPKIVMDNEELYILSTSRWAALEIFKSVQRELMRIPWITGEEQESAVDIINNFIFDMNRYVEASDSRRKKKMFMVSRDTAFDILETLDREYYGV